MYLRVAKVCIHQQDIFVQALGYGGRKIGSDKRLALALKGAGDKDGFRSGALCRSGDPGPEEAELFCYG